MILDQDGKPIEDDKERNLFNMNLHKNENDLVLLRHDLAEVRIGIIKLVKLFEELRKEEWLRNV